MNCDCIYCFKGDDHPVTHTEYRVQHTGTKLIEVCITCGHIRKEWD